MVCVKCVLRLTEVQNATIYKQSGGNAVETEKDNDWFTYRIIDAVTTAEIT
jgi:hypothetical protein